MLGLSRHNERCRKGVIVEFSRTLQGIDYEMTWTFLFDWKNKTRLWSTRIEGANGADYAFQLTGQLFDHDELAQLCQEQFARVEVRDVAKSHYDVYILGYV